MPWLWLKTPLFSPFNQTSARCFVFQCTKETSQAKPKSSKWDHKSETVPESADTCVRAFHCWDSASLSSFQSHHPLLRNEFTRLVINGSFGPTVAQQKQLNQKQICPPSSVLITKDNSARQARPREALSGTLASPLTVGRMGCLIRKTSSAFSRHMTEEQSDSFY